MKWNKKDNSMEPEKIRLRKTFLPKEAHVLDLFCGTGKMYKGAYKNRAKGYKGIDYKKIHDKKLCVLTNNIRYVQKRDISKYNVFDLDDYGCPWKLIYLILKRAKQEKITMFITDGLVLKQKMGGDVVKIVSATEQVPRNMNIPGQNRFYVDMFATMLKDLERRYKYKTTRAIYFHNFRRTVYYWALQMQRTV